MEDEEDRCDIGCKLLALSLEIRAIGQDVVWFAILFFNLSVRALTQTRTHTQRWPLVFHRVSAESWEVIMRRQVPHRLLVAGLSFVIREKRRAGLFFFSPLSPVLWLKAVSRYRQTSDEDTHTHTQVHSLRHVWWAKFDSIKWSLSVSQWSVGMNADGQTVNPTELNRIWSSLFRHSRHWGWLSSGRPNYDYFMSVT